MLGDNACRNPGHAAARALSPDSCALCLVESLMAEAGLTVRRRRIGKQLVSVLKNARAQEAKAQAPLLVHLLNTFLGVYRGEAGVMEIL